MSAALPSRRFSTGATLAALPAAAASRIKSWVNWVCFRPLLQRRVPEEGGQGEGSRGAGGAAHRPPHPPHDQAGVDPQHPGGRVGWDGASPRVHRTAAQHSARSAARRAGKPPFGVAPPCSCPPSPAKQSAPPARCSPALPLTGAVLGAELRWGALHRAPGGDCCGRGAGAVRWAACCPAAVLRLCPAPPLLAWLACVWPCCSYLVWCQRVGARRMLLPLVD